MSMRHKSQQSKRNGSVLVMTVFGIVVLITVTAIVVDIGYLHNARAELQRSADAAALAACWELAEQFADNESMSHIIDETQSAAAGTANANDICNGLPVVPNSDIEVGYLSNFDDGDLPLDFSDPAKFNAVRVTVKKNSQINGQVDTYFARVMGINGLDADSTSTAAIVRDIRGFKIPSDGSNLDLLPFALDEQTWNSMLAGNASDNYAYNPDTKIVSSGSDGKLEVNLYPQDTGSPGNRGTVDIGPSNNSTNDIARQIVHGVNAADMNAIGGTLEFDANGELTLNGDTGISAGVKDELASIIGQTRIIPIFSGVSGNGNNANYTISQFVGVRILGVKLTGPKKNKHLTVQPAPITSKGIIVGDGTNETTKYVFSRAFLVN
jgi:Flp pilus assembly protein TadG